MKLQEKYSIDFSGLAEGNYDYDFEVNDTFFDFFEYAEIKKGKVKIGAILQKHPEIMYLDLTFNGMVIASCDRCLENLNIPIEQTYSFTVKQSDDTSDEAENVILIPHTIQKIFLAQYIYECIHLCLPMQKVHPDKPDKNGNNTCDLSMIKKLEELKPKKKKETDPRWEKLKEIYKN